MCALLEESGDHRDQGDGKYGKAWNHYRGSRRERQPRDPVEFSVGSLAHNALHFPINATSAVAVPDPVGEPLPLR